MTAKKLPDGWYVATMDDGIREGPFATKSDAIINVGSDSSPKRYGPGAYSVGSKFWVVNVRRGVVPGKFEVGEFFTLRTKQGESVERLRDAQVTALERVKQLAGISGY